MSTHQILNWIDDAALGIGKAAMDYRRLGSEESLLELGRSISQLQALTEELIAQHDVRYNR